MFRRRARGPVPQRDHAEHRRRPRRPPRKSRAGDFDALQLDYDLPGNPAIIRSIEDEVRELSPGLRLGQAYLHSPSRDLLWLYFGLAPS